MRSKRLEFSRETKEQAYERCGGKCELCRTAFNGREPEYHHEIEAAMGGDNSLDNCQVLCPKCHGLITRTISVPRVAKVKRIEAKRKGWKKKSYTWRKWTPRRELDPDT